MRCRLAALLFCLAAASLAPAQDAVVLKADSSIRIVEYGNFENARGWLAELLGKYLMLSLGKSGLDGKGESVTFVLEARAPEWPQIPKEFMREAADIDAFEIEVRPGVSPVVRITGNTVLATGFGVMHFLENSIGVTWVFPGDLGVCLPERREFTLAAGRLRQSPQVVSRLYTGFVYRDPGIPARCYVYEGLVHRESVFFYSYDYFKSARPQFLASPSHNMINLFPPELEKTVPDIFPMKDGKRWFPPDKATDKVGAWQAWHPCYTNPKTVEIAVRKAREAFEKQHAYCFSLGINDGRRVQCQCDECKKIGWPQSYYQFVTKVAEQVKDFYPPHLVGVLAYGDVALPPKDLKLPENVLVMVTGGTDRFKEWTAAASILGVYEYASGWGYWVPNIPLKAVESNAQFYRRSGVRFYRSEMHPFWAFDAPRLFIQTHQLWDPELKAEELLRRFCGAAYGPAAAPMRRFYTYWSDRWDGTIVPDGLTMQDPGKPLQDQWRQPLRQFRQRRPEDYATSRECLRAAAAAAPKGPAADRVAMVEAFLEDSATLYDMYRLIGDMTDKAPEAGAGERIARAQVLVAQRRDGLVKMKSHSEWFAGSSMTVGDDLKPSWETWDAMNFPRVLENGIRGELLRLGKAAPPEGLSESLRMCLRPAKAEPAKPQISGMTWYYPWASVALETAQEENAIRFKTTARTDQRITERPAFAERRKLHGLAVNSPLAPIRDNDLYVVEVTATGRQGFLSISVSFGSNNRSRAEGFALTDFSDKAGSVSKRFVLPPTFLNQSTLEADALPKEGSNGLVYVHLLWDPSTDDSSLDGTCRITRLTF